MRYPLDPKEKRTLITASRRASFCFFHSFLAPCWLSSLAPEIFISFQSGAWGSCTVVLHTDLHFATLTASKKLRAGSVLQCSTYDMTDEGLESCLSLTPRCVSTREVRSAEIFAPFLKACLHLCVSEEQVFGLFFFVCLFFFTLIEFPWLHRAPEMYFLRRLGKNNNSETK